MLRRWPPISSRLSTTLPLQEPPHTYKALVCDKLGHPSEPLGHPHGALKLQQLPAPPLTHPNAVRIRVAASALNFADALQLQVGGGPGRAGGCRQRPTVQGSGRAECRCPLGFAGRAMAASAPSLAPCAAWLGLRRSGSRPTHPLSPACSRALLHAASQGLYQERPKLPFVPGSECSGTVVEVGRDVRTLRVGDKVRLPFNWVCHPACCFLASRVSVLQRC